MFMNKKQYQNLGFNTRGDLEDFLNRKDIKSIIGENYDHYRELWLAQYDRIVNNEPKKKVKGAFNWLALLSFLVWAAYRKLYSSFFALFVLMVALSFAEAYYDANLSAGLTGIWIVFAFISKDLYLLHLVSVARKLDRMQDEDKKERFLKRREGVSKLYAWLSIPVFIVINSIAVFIALALRG